MKSGIKIRVGSYNKDLTEARPTELETWLRTLDREALITTVRVLVSDLRVVPEFPRG
jgi:hypothetical protein